MEGYWLLLNLSKGWERSPMNGKLSFQAEVLKKALKCLCISSLVLFCFRQAALGTSVPNSGQENRTSSKQPSGKPANRAAKPLAEEAPFNDRHVPYPYFSSLTEREQRRYLFLLSKYAKADPNRIDLSRQKDYTEYLVSVEFLFPIIITCLT